MSSFLKKWIRLKGFAAFLIIVSAICLIVFLAVDPIAKMVIEKAGTKAVGAKVRVENVDVGFIPAGMRIDGLTVANPHHPMENAADISEIAFFIDLPALFGRKIHIDEMSVEGIRLNTARLVSGAVEDSASGEKQKKPFAFEMPGLDEKAFKEIIERETEKIHREAEKLYSEIYRQKDLFEKKLEDLPDRDALEKYEKRIKDLKKYKSGSFSDIMKAAKEIDDIQKDIQKDLDALKDAEKDIKAQIAEIDRKVDDFSAQVKKDLKKKLEEYTDIESAAVNLTELLIGEKYARWIETAFSWYEKIGPLLNSSGDGVKEPEPRKPERHKGVDIKFAEETPSPDVYIGKLSASFPVQGGDIKGEVFQISSDQRLTGKPLTFKFGGDELKEIKKAGLSGSLDHIIPGESKDRLTAGIEGYTIKHFILSDDETLPITIADAASDLGMDVSIRGNEVNGFVKIALKSAEIKTGQASSASSWRKTLSGSLEKVSEINIRADVTGFLDDYKISITSDIDNILSGVIKDMIREQKAAFEKRIETALAGQAASDKNRIETGRKELEGLLGEIEKRIQAAN